MLSSTVVTSQPLSNTANTFALSATFIFSMATSQLPAWIAWTARLKADEPEAQAFSIVYTGTPSKPQRHIAMGPEMMYCPCGSPLVVPA